VNPSRSRLPRFVGFERGTTDKMVLGQAANAPYTALMRTIIATVIVAASTLVPATAFAQRFPFERSIQISGQTKLDVSTVRGKIIIVAGAPGRVVVEGDVTVRAGWDVPANAVELARQVAASPPIHHAGDTVKLTIPVDRAAQRGVTVSYRVQVPPDADVQTSSNSGETSISGIGGPVDVRTQSGRIALQRLTGVVRASTGSGAVSADDVAGGLRVTTTSSSFNGTGLGSSLWVRTQSGEIDAALTGAGDVDVETGSSAIRLSGLRGALSATTQSGRLNVQGAPLRPWIAHTQSSSVNLDLEPGIGFSLDATSRSGSVVVNGGPLQGSAAKGLAKGTVNGGGALVRVNTGSGAIRVQLERRW
jgi:DUF4097 and DUF4098 domain-containing protein YvlB